MVVGLIVEEEMMVKQVIPANEDDLRSLNARNATQVCSLTFFRQGGVHADLQATFELHRADLDSSDNHKASLRSSRQKFKHHHASHTATEYSA